MFLLFSCSKFSVGTVGNLRLNSRERYNNMKLSNVYQIVLRIGWVGRSGLSQDIKKKKTNKRGYAKKKFNYTTTYARKKMQTVSFVY